MKMWHEGAVCKPHEGNGLFEEKRLSEQLDGESQERPHRERVELTLAKHPNRATTFPSAKSRATAFGQSAKRMAFTPAEAKASASSFSVYAGPRLQVFHARERTSPFSKSNARVAPTPVPPSPMAG